MSDFITIAACMREVKVVYIVLCRGMKMDIK